MAKAHLRLGKALKMLGMFDLAKRSLMKCKDLAPSSGDVTTQLSEVMQLATCMDKARQALASGSHKIAVMYTDQLLSKCQSREAQRIKADALLADGKFDDL